MRSTRFKLVCINAGTALLDAAGGSAKLTKAAANSNTTYLKEAGLEAASWRTGFPEKPAGVRAIAECAKQRHRHPSPQPFWIERSRKSKVKAQDSGISAMKSR